MFVLVCRISVYNGQTTDNHPNIVPSRFLLFDREVRGNMEIGNSFVTLVLEVNSSQYDVGVPT